MALIDNRAFLKWFGLYCVAAFIVAGIVERLPEPNSAGWVAALGFAFFFLVLTVTLPLVGIFYSALFQSFKAKKFGWFFVVLFLNILGAYAYAFWGHEPESTDIAA